MELYDAIFYRKSIRKYSNKKITNELMEEIKNISSNITYLNNDLNIKAHVVERGHLIHFLMGKKNKVKAPHYILLTSNKGEDYLQNVGFAAEEIVLQLTILGVATCWLECNLKREDILEFIDIQEVEDTNENEKTENAEEELEYPVALIAFGYPEGNEKLFREQDDDIDRKSIKKICKKIDKKYTSIIEAIRLAPSINNSQPWLLYKDIDGFSIYEEKSKKNIRDMSKISMGIALKHLDIACKNNNIDAIYEKRKNKNKIGKGYYINTILK